MGLSWTTEAPRSLSRCYYQRLTVRLESTPSVHPCFLNTAPFLSWKIVLYVSKIENSICRAGTRMSENDIHGSVFPCKIIPIQLLMKGHLCILISFFIMLLVYSYSRRFELLFGRRNICANCTEQNLYNFKLRFFFEIFYFRFLINASKMFSQKLLKCSIRVSYELNLNLAI